MAKMRQNDEKDFPGVPYGTNAKIPISSAPEKQNLSPNLPQKKQTQFRPNKHKVRLRNV